MSVTRLPELPPHLKVAKSAPASAPTPGWPYSPGTFEGDHLYGLETKVWYGLVTLWLRHAPPEETRRATGTDLHERVRAFIEEQQGGNGNSLSDSELTALGVLVDPDPLAVFIVESMCRDSFDYYRQREERMREAVKKQMRYRMSEVENAYTVVRTTDNTLKDFKA